MSSFSRKIKEILAKTPLSREFHLLYWQRKLLCFGEDADWNEEGLVLNPEGCRGGKFVKLLKVLEENTEFYGQLLV